MRARRLVPVATAILLATGAVGLAGSPASSLDPRDTGLSTAWLVFGFAAQAVFGLRFLIQWIASERAKDSVVPRGFWVLSLVGGVALFFYFFRRGDPVGMAGQIFGVIVYSRNLYLLEQKRRRPAAAAAACAAAPASRREEPVARG
jgi:lipid-A-disaccharide synthase-like uncharacterized protein